MSPSSDAPSGTLGRLVVRNTIYLTISQALTVPLSVLMNAVMGRYLGAADFGVLYLVGEIAYFGLLAINWGHDGALPALIARDRASSGTLIASSWVWRICVSGVAYVLFAFVCHLLKYSATFQWALALTFAINLLTSLIAASKDTIRGFERTDIPAITHVGQQLATAAVVVPVLMLGGGIRAILLAQIPVCIVVFALLWRTLRPVGVSKLTVKKSAIKALFVGGTPFIFFGIAMALQPNIDAVVLSKMAPPEVMGWFAASRRLIGLLVFPASALVGALYPTLCRLFAEDKESYARVARGAFQGVSQLAVPVALGCALYSELGVEVFSRKSFAGASDNLQILALFLFLMYFSMPVGTCVVAGGRQRAWSIVQCLCIVVSAVLDPLLVPWFQAHKGNGGLGVCVACITSELFVVGFGFVLMPRGIFDRRLVRTLALAALSGGAMAVFAHFTRFINPWIAAPVSVAVYAAVLAVTGGIEPQQLAAARGFFRSKFSRS